jgi:hypothetical protein
MPFRHAYRVVEPCIVAIVQKSHIQNQHMPNTWGSGFLVSEHGASLLPARTSSTRLALGLCPHERRLAW